MSSLSKEFLKTLEKCGEARAEGECFSLFSSVVKNSQVLIELKNTRGASFFFNFFYKMYREFRALVRRLIFQQYTHLT